MMKETASYKIIGKEAETACFKIYHSAKSSPAVKERAKLMVIESNLRFVLKMAIDYHKCTGLPITDFYSDGKLGLLDAFYRYDWREGVKFGSYAVWYIRTHMGASVNERELTRVPARLRHKVLMAIKDGKDPMAIRYGEDAVRSMFHTITIDTPIEGGDDDGTVLTVGDTIVSESMDVDRDHGLELLKERLDSEMKCTLSSNEVKLLKTLYGIDGEESSLGDVANELGTSKDWVRKAKAKAIAKLRASGGLDDFKEGIS